MSSQLIDQLLSDFRPSTDGAIQRGQDFKTLSETEDDGLLDELAPGGEHNAANPGTGIVAAEQDWQQNGGRPFTTEDSLMNDVLKQSSGEKVDEERLGKPMMASADVKIRIRALLHLGKTPKQVTAYLNKLAEQQMFDRTESDGFLKDQAGLLGYAYLEPNHFNQKSCTASMRHIKANGVIKAASVKRIAACDGCENCKSDLEGGSKCATYGLPIVSSEKDLKGIVARLAGSQMKRASLVARHNGESTARPGHTVNVIARSEERDATLTTAGVSRVAAWDAQKARENATSFTPKTVTASIEGGQTLNDVYVASKKAYGSAKTQKVVREYLDSLKKTGARINLAAVDCLILKRRLTASETILGKDKCSSCSFRAGMHCGFTGGTLLSYPGMEKQAKTASVAAADGVATMDGLELRAPELTIDFAQDRQLLDVEMPSIAALQF
jgi:hypothetical protein